MKEGRREGGKEEGSVWRGEREVSKSQTFISRIHRPVHSMSAEIAQLTT